MTATLVGIIIKRDSPRIKQVGIELVDWFDRQGIAAQLDVIERHDIPVIGINLGNLGFLTEVAEDEMFQALEEVLSGGGRLEKRMMLKIHLVNGSGRKSGEFLFGLNEVAIVKGNVEQVIRLYSWANDEYITTYKADGLIISTPTGSTAYNLSAGGPIVHAQLNALLLTPICPFMLESRPVLLSAGTRITTQLADPANDVKVMVDGRFSWDMSKDDCLVVEAARKPLKLYSSPRLGYFTILRNKLNWGGRATGFPLPAKVGGGDKDPVQ
jgi:NAD+ kinase